MYIVTNTLYTAQNFVEALTEKCYFYNNGEGDYEFIHRHLIENGIEPKCAEGKLSDFSLTDANNPVYEDCCVVLVDCLYENEDKPEFTHCLRLWEIPEDKISCFAQDVYKPHKATNERQNLLDSYEGDKVFTTVVHYEGSRSYEIRANSEEEAEERAKDVFGLESANDLINDLADVVVCDCWENK